MDSKIFLSACLWEGKTRELVVDRAEIARVWWKIFSGVSSLLSSFWGMNPFNSSNNQLSLCIYFHPAFAQDLYHLTALWLITNYFRLDPGVDRSNYL